MEKKLKINFILKGIAVFAFVAFCLLAILAGVTLPFVSNASTIDCAVVSAESDCATASADSGSIYIPLLEVQSNTLYYSISVPNDNININADIPSSSFRVFTASVPNSDISFPCVAFKAYGSNYNTVELNYTKGEISYTYQSLLTANVYSNEFRFDSGFYIDSSNIHSNASKLNILIRTIPFSSDIEVESLNNQIATLTAEKNALQIQVNSLTSDKESLQAQLTEKNNQIDTLTAEKATLQSQLTEKQNQIDTLTAENSSLQGQVTDKQNQIDTLTAEKSTLQSQLTEKQNQIDTLTAENSSLQGQVTDKQNQIDTLTAEKNALQTQVNNLTVENNDLENRLGFNSEFGFIGNLRSNRIYFNLKFAPKIPSDKLCPYGENAIINGYYKQGNDFYLPVLVAYDSSGNEVTAGFTGWKFTCVLNPDGSPTTSFRLDFFVENLAVYHIDSVELNGKCFTTPDYSHGYAIVGADYVGSGISVYSSPKSQYFYDLKPNYFSQSQVRNFLAFFHYLTYVPVDDAFYLAGLNAASKGYYDDGYKKGYSAGEDVGYNSGFSAGDAQGFARGVESANTYSFLGLFGAIFDAPIKAIFGGTSTLPAGTTITDSNGNTITLQSTTTVNRAGLLNFNLMGVNLSGFVLALFSLSILVVVIKFALAKGR